MHLLTIWAVALGAILSAAFIMAANSWMQHPVGYAINHKTGKPHLNDIWAVLTNPVFLWGHAHVPLASLVTGPRVTSGRRGCSAAGRRGACPGPVSRPRMAGKPCSRVAAGRDHPREAMPAERACAQIAGPELKELRWQQTRPTH